LAPSSRSLEFGSIPAGSQGVAEVTFMNTGGPLKISSVRAPSAPFAATGLPGTATTIKPCEVFTAQVTFSPTAPGGYNGSFGLTTELGETSVSLSGSAPTPPPPPAPAPSPQAKTATNPPPEPLIALSNLKLRYPASKSSRSKHKALISFTLNLDGKVKIVVYKRVVSHHCAKKARSCVRYVPTSIKLTFNGKAGSDRLTIDLTKLHSGAFRLSATPIAKSGAATATRSVSFSIR
jgi:hypothetical protein